MEASLEETLSLRHLKPIDDLTKLFTKLRKDKSFLERDYYFSTYVGV